MHCIGLDIGGVNLKAAHPDGRTATRPFAVWKAPERLADELTRVLSEFPQCELVAMTMTAELADCFPTKSAGVDAILRAVELAAAPRPVFVWQTGAEFVRPDEAREIPLLVAAANWHALATWLGRMVPSGGALLIDVGSTTTDLVPLLDGVPVPQGLTDCERLQAGELVYSGVRRTPLCAIAHSVPLRDGYCPVAAELFATTLDLYLLTGDILEDPEDTNTANGRPATKPDAADRLVRMLCCDRTELGQDDLDLIVRFLVDVHRQRLAGPLDHVLQRMPAPCQSVIVSGSGSFLAGRLVEQNPRLAAATVTTLQDTLTPGIAQAACAFAVARLGAERLSGEPL